MVAALVLLFAAFQGWAAEPRWLHLQSPHFEMYTTHGERAARRGITHFEQVRAFFTHVLDLHPKATKPVRLIVFRGEKEYQPYRFSESTFAYYTAGPDRDYIVMQDFDAEQFRVVVHEYLHLLVSHSGMKLPLWLNEGFAEVYSTIRPMGGRVQIGAPIQAYYFVLTQGKLLPLETLFAVAHDSPEYNEKNRAGLFYAQSWALTHMLMFDPDYRMKSPALIPAADAGRDPNALFLEVYGKDTGQVFKDLRSYIRQSAFYAADVDFKFPKAVENIEVRAAPAVDAGLVRANLLTSLGRFDAARDLLAPLAAEDAGNWRVAEAQAYADLYAGRMDASIEHFGRAAKLGAGNAKTWFDYARLLVDADRGDDAVAALMEAVRLEPAEYRVRMFLAHLLIRRKEYGSAYGYLSQVKNVEPDQAFAFFSSLALCQHELKRPDEARKSLERAIEFAQSPEERERATRFREYLQQVGDAERRP